MALRRRRGTVFREMETLAEAVADVRPRRVGAPPPRRPGRELQRALRGVQMPPVVRAAAAAPDWRLLFTDIRPPPVTAGMCVSRPTPPADAPQAPAPRPVPDFVDTSAHLAAAEVQQAMHVAEKRGKHGEKTRGVRSLPQTPASVMAEQRAWRDELVAAGQTRVLEVTYEALQLGEPAPEARAAARAADFVTGAPPEAGGSAALVREAAQSAGPQEAIVQRHLGRNDVLGGFIPSAAAMELTMRPNGQLAFRVTEPPAPPGGAPAPQMSSAAYQLSCMQAMGKRVTLRGEGLLEEHMVTDPSLMGPLLEFISRPAVPAPANTHMSDTLVTARCPVIDLSVILSYLRTPKLELGELPCSNNDRCRGNAVEVPRRATLVSFHVLQMAVEFNFESVTDENRAELARLYYDRGGANRPGLCVMCISCNVTRQHFTAMGLWSTQPALYHAEPGGGAAGNEIINPFRVIVDEPGQFHPHDCIGPMRGVHTGLFGHMFIHTNSAYTQRVMCEDCVPVTYFVPHLREVRFNDRAHFRAGSR